MTTKSALFKQFENYSKESLNQQFKPKINDNIRIMSFNVHFWKNYKNNYTKNDILKVIENSDADIIGLQEATFFGNSFSEKNKFINDIELLGYIYYKMCNDRYGLNILLSKNKIIDYQIIKLVRRSQFLVKSRDEQRYALICKIQLSEDEIINIVLTHLDVHDETEITRLEQIKQILSVMPSKSIIIGDFNSLRKKDYVADRWNQIVSNNKERGLDTMTLVTDIIESNNFFDSFDICFKKCDVSVWSMRRVDYIYISQDFPYTIRDSNVLATESSDHYPIYIDIIS